MCNSTKYFPPRCNYLSYFLIICYLGYANVFLFWVYICSRTVWNPLLEILKCISCNFINGWWPELAAVFFWWEVTLGNLRSEVIKGHLDRGPTVWNHSKCLHLMSVITMLILRWGGQHASVIWGVNSLHSGRPSNYASIITRSSFHVPVPTVIVI